MDEEAMTFFLATIVCWFTFKLILKIDIGFERIRKMTMKEVLIHGIKQALVLTLGLWLLVLFLGLAIGIGKEFLQVIVTK